MGRRRSWKRTVITLLAVIGLVYFGGLWFLRSAYAAEQVAARLGAAAGAPVRIADLDLGFVRSPLTGLEVCERGAPADAPPWLTIGAVDAELSLAQLIRGDLADGTVTLRHVHVTLHFDRDGRLLTRLPEPAAEEGGPL